MDSETIFQNKFQATSERIRFTLVSAFAMVHRAIAQECRMHGVSEAVTASIEEKLFSVADGLAGELQGLTAPPLMSAQLEPPLPEPTAPPDPAGELSDSPPPSPVDPVPENPIADGEPASSVEPPVVEETSPPVVLSDTVTQSMETETDPA